MLFHEAVLQSVREFIPPVALVGGKNRFPIHGAVSSDATSNLLCEFTSDLKRSLGKHAPKEVKKVEERFPIPEDDKP
jgi:hypothetical protein